MADWCNQKKDYAQGSIVRIKLEHFVTYDSLEFSPGANLNVIIGPNGTGKSSIVCAICLGMAGKPSVLGRAAAISEYIKYGRSKATIEIELNNTQGKNFTIRRYIYKDNKSDWFLNERPVKLKDIEDVVSSLNIQVNNLCQFLPQEKVAEFARLDTYALLESTEKAVGGNELYQRHQDLKENSRESYELERDVLSHEEDLKREEAANARLESQVKSYKEKKKFEENVLWLKRKRACLVYTEKRKSHSEIKARKDNIANDMEMLNRHLTPMQEKLANLDAKLKKQREVIAVKSKQMQECDKTGRLLTTHLNELVERVNEVKEEYNNKREEMGLRQTAIQKLKETVEIQKSQWEEGKERLPEIEASETEIRARDGKVNSEVMKVNERQYEVRRETEKLSGELRELKEQLLMMNSVREDKLAKLKGAAIYQHAWKAIKWLEENRGMFKGAVYEPMFLLINVKSNNASSCVESTINNRDLCQMFLFEKSEDMHLFITEIRDKQQLVVNTAIAPNQASASFQPLKPIESIKKYGFQSYIRELIEAPEAVLSYLCMCYQIHNIPVGNDYTQKNLTHILPHISEFQKIYTNIHSYQFIKSRYTGEVSSLSNEISNGYFLTNSIDSTKINVLDKRRKEIEGSLAVLASESQELDTQKRELEKKLEASRSVIGTLRERRQYIDNQKKKYEFSLSKLKKLEQETKDLFPDAESKAKLLEEITRKRVKLFSDYVANAESLMVLNKDKLMASYQDAYVQSEKRQIEAELREYAGRKQELENLVENIDELIRQAKDEAKRALEEASRVCEVQIIKDLPDSHRQKFNQLPDSIEEVDAEIHKVEAISSVSCDVDDRVVEEYEQREKLIEKRKRNLEKLRTKLTQQKDNYEELKNGWLEQVETIINGINEKFMMLFRQLKCCGEVMLRIPDAADDFSKYGVKIMVSFRSDEQMQELTAWQQSGGEKSVSTMMYMIALQEMTKCPFRVVDEINQGMDPVNERKVFDIIVQNSCSKQFAQYFLLTPKLLADLNFDERTNVICVFNGPKNLAHTKYNLNRFIENRKKLNERERE